MENRLETVEVIKWRYLDRHLTENVLLVDFVLDGNNKLPHETYNYLKETYKTLRERNLSQ